MSTRNRKSAADASEKGGGGASLLQNESEKQSLLESASHKDSEKQSLLESSNKDAVTEKDKSEIENPTNWRAIILCSAIYFFITTILQALNVIPYVYLQKELDPSISPTYAGLILASVKVGHAIGTIIFSIYAYTTKCFKIPLLIGRGISLLALIIFIGIKLIPGQSLRVVFCLTFLLQSLAEASMIVIRSYIPRVSTKKDRQGAYGIISGAMMLSIVAGPAINMSMMAVPVKEAYWWLIFDKYTYPAWIGVIICTAMTFVIIFSVDEPPPIKEELEKPGFAATMKLCYRQIMEIDKVALVVLFIEKCIASVSFSALLSCIAPFMEVIVNSDKNWMYIAASQTVVGIISIATVAVVILTPIGKARGSLLFFFSLGCYFIMYVWSYPWPGVSQPIAVKDYNATANITTNPFGCNATELVWCADQNHVKLWFWLPVTIPLMGMAVPTSMISLDSVYSKLLGNIDQNIMQGALVIADDLASSVAPVVTMKIFTDSGPSTFWLLLAGNVLIGILLWIPMIPKMRKLNL